MKMYTTYSVKIKHYNSIFKETVAIYRHAVGYILNVCLENWEEMSSLEGRNRLFYVERLIHATKDNPVPTYNFDSKFCAHGGIKFLSLGCICRNAVPAF